MRMKTHRIMVETTFDRPTTERHARKIMTRLLEGDPLQQVVFEEAVRADGVEFTHYAVKSGERVIQQEVRKVLEARAPVSKRGLAPCDTDEL